MLPDPSSRFGRQVRERLADEPLIWFTTVGRDGTPQPNPVWFVWDGDSVLVYNTPRAQRLVHIRRRPQVSLHLNSRNGGGVVVVIGTAEIAEAEPPANQHPGYVAKYGEPMVAISGSQEAFAGAYSVPVRVRPTNIRGW